MRIGTIGTGSIVENFLNAFRDAKNVECTAVYSRKEETAREFADKFQVRQIYTDYERMLEDDNIDFIYVASPNSLHYDYTLRALQKGKNVICEKPFTSTVEEAETLIQLAGRSNLFLFEAITTLHFPNYKKIKEMLPSIGDIKVVQCNYSQYSSRYDKLLAGEVTNVFDPAFSGGSLVDINIYNLHFVIGLFGEPGQVIYMANKAGNGIDTSGIALLKYDGFVCECVGSKDSYSPSFAVIQGTKGYIKVQSPPNECRSFEVGIGDRIETHNEQQISNRMAYEVIAFEEMYRLGDFHRCHELLDHSLRVMKAAVLARKDAGIVFAADHNQ